MLMLTLLTIATGTDRPPARPPAGPPDLAILVSVDWLSQHLGDPDLVIFQIGDGASKRTYDAGHIPGAQFLNPFSELAAPQGGGSGLALELPQVAQLDSVLEAKGVSNSTRIVLYSADEYYSPTSRAFFTLEYAGMAGKVVMLDGGLEAWRAAGKPVATEVPTPKRGSFTPSLKPEMVVDAAWVKDHLQDSKVQIIDARTPNFYNGGETRQPRVGRIPGASNVPFGTVIKDGSTTFKDPATLKSILQAAGAADGDTVVTYCHIGQQASLVWFAARLLGYQARLYDGSMQDWSARRELPIEAPPPTVRDSMLVTADWLKAHLSDSNVVVLHADRNRTAFDEAHIPLARFADWAAFTTKNETLTTEMPAMEALGAWVQTLGLRPNQRIIIYGDPVPAARLYFTLEYLALSNRASILDGGLAGWRATGGEVTAKPIEFEKSTFQPRFVWRELIVNSDFVKSRLGDSTTAIIDARSLDEYKGNKGPADLRPGHIPGAASLDWTTLVDNGKFKSPTVLRGMFEQAGVAAGDDLIIYCHSGARSSVDWFVAKYLGYRPRMYDGSMEDWSRKAELPVEK
ncbi:MAG TPA: sulfurtransferase [Gemmatimonadales bacterium]|nr:sulfurtransferase [Gemmatimonadales bacterium]